MTRYSRFDNGIWDQPWFRELPDESPLLWLWLNHNRSTSPCGLWRIDLCEASHATLLPERDIARRLTAWDRLGLLRSDGRFVLLPDHAREQSLTPRLQRRALRDAIVLACDTPLAMEWLAEQRGDNVDTLRTGDSFRGQLAG
jgi:hypothetical protein